LHYSEASRFGVEFSPGKMNIGQTANYPGGAIEFGMSIRFFHRIGEIQ
jgi:hypothetical protein